MSHINTRDIDVLVGAVYFAVGRGTEGGEASYHLSIAGLTVGTAEPRWGQVERIADNSGYSLGAIQVDLGQRGNWPLGAIAHRRIEPDEQSYAAAIVDQASAYARKNHLPFDEDSTQLRADLLSHGNGQRGRSSLTFIDTRTRDSINAWAGSDDGKQWIHRNVDIPQVRNATQTALAMLDEHGSRVSEDHRFEAICLLAKTANQIPSQLPKLEKILRNGGDYEALRAEASRIKGIYAYYDGPKAADLGQRYENGYASNRDALDRAHEKVAGPDFRPGNEVADADVQIALSLSGVARPHPGVLSEGAAGREVRKLEVNLQGLGYGNSSGQHLTVDSRFDASTTASVEAFQYSSRLQMDGSANRETLSEIDVRVRDTQRVLKELGFTAANGSALKVDGYFGQGTAEAIKAFQEANSIEGNGVADGTTRHALNSSAVSLGFPPMSEFNRSPEKFIAPPIDAELRGLVPSTANPAGPGSARIAPPYQSNHPNYALYQQCRAGVEALDRQLGRQPDGNSERMAASLTCLAVNTGLERVDHVLLSERGSKVDAGENVFIVQGDSKDPSHLRAHMATDRAIRTPVEASLRDLAQLERQPAAPSPEMQRLDEQHRGPQVMGA